ncbi:MAG: DUF6499 domain-containing protein [Rhizomicrobium sp.]
METSKNRLDWRSRGAYEDLQSFDAPGFAWEFLRRNPTFNKDLQKLERAMRQRKLTLAEKDAFALKWGLRFRTAKRIGKRQCGSMDGTSDAECRGLDDSCGEPC